MSKRYVIFNEHQVVSNVYKYFSGVKYAVQKETLGSFYLLGEDGNLNRFLKDQIQGGYLYGNVIQDVNNPQP